MSIHCLLLQLLLLLAANHAQLLPDNPCTQHFQYVQHGNRGDVHGELTLPLKTGENRVDVSFSQRNDHAQAAVGVLRPYPDEATARANAQASKFRVSLQPDAFGVLPKLTRLTFNDVILCTAADYRPPTTFFNRFYVLYNFAPLFNNPDLYNQRLSPHADVEVKTVYINAPAGSHNPDQGFTHFIDEWTYEDNSTHVDAEPVPRILVPWPTPPSKVSSSTTTSAPTNPPPPSPPTTIRPPIPAPTPTRTNLVDCGLEGTYVPFIQLGDVIPRGRYPWLTAIFHIENFLMSFKCGGSLISNSWVITAAHCVHQVTEDRIVVSLGRHDMDNSKEEGSVRRQVHHVILHPEFSTRPQRQPDADIALITLKERVTYNDVIRPICLWEAPNDAMDESGSIAGWGTDEEGNPSTRFPHVVNVKIPSDAECARKWKADTLLERTLCAGNLDGSGPCLGDSGGGLMVRRGHRWLLRGIVSQGERSSKGNCNLNQYVLYTDLSKHLTWISQILINNFS